MVMNSVACILYPHSFGTFYCILYFRIQLDIDECTTNTDDCSHDCYNNIGSYTCDCELGFQLDEDKTTCIGMHEIPLLPVIEPCFFILCDL